MGRAANHSAGHPEEEVDQKRYRRELLDEIHVWTSERSAVLHPGLGVLGRPDCDLSHIYPGTGIPAGRFAWAIYPAMPHSFSRFLVLMRDSRG
jgi:hypothetical protein